MTGVAGFGRGLAVEGEAATAERRRRGRAGRDRCAPRGALADHPDGLARPRIPRGIEMLQPQRDRVAPQRAGEFVDEGFAGKGVPVAGNRCAGIGQLDRRPRVPVDERRRRARIRSRVFSPASIVPSRAGRLRAIAPGHHPPVGCGLRFDIERCTRVRVADRPFVARAVRMRCLGGSCVARVGRRRALRLRRQARITLHRRLADNVRRDAPHG